MCETTARYRMVSVLTIGSKSIFKFLTKLLAKCFSSDKKETLKKNFKNNWTVVPPKALSPLCQSMQSLPSAAVVEYSSGEVESPLCLSKATKLGHRHVLRNQLHLLAADRTEWKLELVESAIAQAPTGTEKCSDQD